VGHEVALSYRGPGSDAEDPVARGIVRFDLTGLLELEARPMEYGKLLASQLLADGALMVEFVRAEAKASSGVLRMILRIDPSAQELHRLRWELLRHPQSGVLLSTSETVLLSRSISSRNAREVKLRARKAVTALIAISAPAPDKLRSMGLAEVDYEGEVKRVRDALGGVEVRTLGGPTDPLTVDRLSEQLRDGVDILYLVSHGMLGRLTGVPALALQDDEGEAKWIKAEDLADRIGELLHRPLLVVLASCQSAGDGNLVAQGTTAQVTLVGHLADAGVPAIIAMQGLITMRTIEMMMPVFFKELLRDGQIDRALAVARSKVRDRDDAWMPALYTRLKVGCLWDNSLGDSPETHWGHRRRVKRRVWVGAMSVALLGVTTLGVGSILHWYFDSPTTRDDETATATAEPEPAKPDTDAPEMVSVPGSDGIESFRLAATEVTQAEWEAMTGNNPSPKAFGVDPRFPVYNVSWAEALEFTNGLSVARGFEPCYRKSSNTWLMVTACEGYRLPTQAEWKHAARLREGPATCETANLADRSLFREQPELVSRLRQLTPGFAPVECDDRFPLLAPVASFPPVSGIYDLDGNVAEWVTRERDAGALAPGIKGTAFLGPGRNEANYDEELPPDGKAGLIGLRLARSGDK
jgi:hypothetical protein